MRNYRLSRERSARRSSFDDAALPTPPQLPLAKCKTKVTRSRDAERMADSRKRQKKAERETELAVIAGRKKKLLAALESSRNLEHVICCGEEIAEAKSAAPREVLRSVPQAHKLLIQFR